MQSYSKVMTVFAILPVALVFVPGVWATGSNQAGNDGNVTFTALYNFDAKRTVATAGGKLKSNKKFRVVK